MSATIRVCIYDDNDLRCEALELLFSGDERFEVVGTFPNCANVLQHIGKLQPQVVLMDIEMPPPDGIAGLKAIKKHYPDIKVIMQTVHEEDEKIFQAVCFGADGYILKKSSPEYIIAAVDEVLQGGAPMSPYIAARVLKMLSGEVRVMLPEFNLTAREIEVLTLLAQGHSYKQVADLCCISYNTVNAHVRNIYEKLQVHSVREAVERLKGKL